MSEQADLDFEPDGGDVSMTVRMPEGAGHVRTLTFRMPPRQAAEVAMRLISVIGAVAQVSTDELKKWVDAG